MRSTRGVVRDKKYMPRLRFWLTATLVVRGVDTSLCGSPCLCPRWRSSRFAPNGSPQYRWAAGMQRVETDSFEFALPANWTYLAEGQRLICHGPDGEELIVSVTAVKNARGEVGDVYVDQLFENALVAMRKTLADPELVVVRDVAIEPSSSVACSLSVARTSDNSVLFSQFAFRSVAAVLFATLETAYSPRHMEIAKSFLGSVRDRVAGPAA